MLLRIYDVTLVLCRELRPLLAVLRTGDPDLASQCRRALTSVALNLAEGAGSQGKNQRARYFNALGSARESRAALEVAVALGLIDAPAPQVLDQLDRVIATLFKLTR